jgi:isoleucyl-tRNA synthetase
MAPILTITTEEAWGYVNMKRRAESIHLESWPDDNHAKWCDEALNAKWTGLIALREAVLKKLEAKRQAGAIGSSLEARVMLASDDPNYKKLFKENRSELRYLFIVSQVELKDTPDDKSDVEPNIPVAVYVEKAKGAKCQRCWNYSEAVGADKAHPTLCERCVKSVLEISLTKEL